MSNTSSQAGFDQRAAGTAPARKRRPAVPLILKLIRLGFRIGGTVAPRFAGRIAYKLWFTPTRFPTPVSERDALASADTARVEINGKHITTYRWGQSGPTVLLVHGWSGRGTQLGAFVEPLINADFRVLSFDGPAHGSSDGKQTTLYEFVDVIHALNDHYGPFESVITHSFGGPCLAVAMQQGFNTSSVVNISPPANTAALIEHFTDTLAIPDKARKDFVRRFERSFGNNILQRSSMENNVSDLDTPALVIHDENDTDIPWHQGQAVAKAWRNAGFIKTSALGHRRILRDAATIERAVAFVRSIKDQQGLSGPG